jgi:hypothetical protein
MFLPLSTDYRNTLAQDTRLRLGLRIRSAAKYERPVPGSATDETPLNNGVTRRAYEEKTRPRL